MDNSRQERADLGKTAGGFVAGLLVGGLVGAGTMLLLAPQSGEKTLAKLQHDGGELRDQVTETLQDAVKEARGTAQRITARVQEQAKELRQRGQDLLDEQTEVVAKAIEARK